MKDRTSAAKAVPARYEEEILRLLRKEALGRRDGRIRDSCSLVVIDEQNVGNETIPVSIHIVHRLTSGHQIARMTTNALEVAFAFILTVLLASISYRFFESPILRYKKRFEVIRTRSV